LRLLSKPLRAFSDKQPEEFKIDEKEMFSKENMEKAKQAISEKMKAIKEQEEKE